MKEVILYTQPSCPPCEFAKKYLQHHSIPFEEKNIARDGRARKELINKYNAFSTPVLVIGEDVIIGFDQDRVNQLLSI